MFTIGSVNALQIDIVNAELYHYDGDCIAKAADMGFPGLVDIRQRQVRHPDLGFLLYRVFPALHGHPRQRQSRRPHHAVRHITICADAATL